MNNWFLILTGGVNTWAAREAEGIAPAAGTVRLVGQVPTLTRSEGEIDGGGEIADFAESNFVAFYDVLGYVESDFTAVYQVLAPAEPSAATLRLVGQSPTVAMAWFIAPIVGTVRLAGNAPTATVTGDVTVSPSGTSLTFTGQVPYLQPVQLWPESATVRVAGQVPEINRIVAPGAGALRFETWGARVYDLTATYTVFDNYVESDFTAFWQRAGAAVSDFTAGYAIYGRVGAVRVRPAANRLYLDPPTLPKIRAVPTQTRIYAKRAA